MIKIGLLWHSISSDNLGIGALTISNIAIVEAIARERDINVEFEIFGWRDSRPAQLIQPNVKIRPLNGRDIIDPSRLYTWIKQCDLVLDISAGDSFADIYGVKRFSYIILSKLVVYLTNRPMIYSPQTIGPFERSWAKFVSVAMMRRARAVVTRDKLSTEYITGLRISNVIEATDVAFRLPYQPSEGSAKGVVRVGMNISGLLFNGGYTRSNMFELKSDYPALARSLIAHFVSLHGCEIYLIGHVNSETFQTEDDYRVATLLAKEFPSAIVAPRFATPSDAKGFISGLDFFCGSRMHACIAAFSSGVPVVPIAYSRKFAGLFGSLGYTTVADCRTQTADEIVALVSQGYAQRHKLKEEVDRGRAMATEKLKNYEAVLRQCMNEIMAGQE